MIILWVLMWILLGLFGLLLVVAIWLLLAPMALQINSGENIYQLRWYSIGGIRIKPNEEELLTFHLKVLFFRWNFHLLHPPERVLKWMRKKRKKKPKQKQDKRKQPVKKGSSVDSWRIMRRILASFKVNTCRLNIDTGNPVYNAWLYPFLPWMNRRENVQIQINWIEKQEIEIDVRNTGWRIVKAILWR